MVDDQRNPGNRIQPWTAVREDRSTFSSPAAGLVEEVFPVIRRDGNDGAVDQLFPSQELG